MVINTRTSRTKAKAEPTPQVLVVKNSPFILPPMTFVEASPSIPVIAYALKTGMNTIVTPLIIPPRDRGRVTLKNVLKPFAPRSADASA